jgi:hypothetical protein
MAGGNPPIPCRIGWSATQLEEATGRERNRRRAPRAISSALDTRHLIQSLTTGRCFTSLSCSKTQPQAEWPAATGQAARTAPVHTPTTTATTSQPDRYSFLEAGTSPGHVISSTRLLQATPPGCNSARRHQATSKRVVVAHAEKVREMTVEGTKVTGILRVAARHIRSGYSGSGHAIFGQTTGARCCCVLVTVRVGTWRTTTTGPVCAVKLPHCPCLCFGLICTPPTSQWANTSTFSFFYSFFFAKTRLLFLTKLQNQ